MRTFFSPIIYTMAIGILCLSIATAQADFAGSQQPPTAASYQAGQTVDVYQGANSSLAGDALPALIFFHGGAWKTGSRTQFTRQAKLLLDSSRLVVLSADYPLKQGPETATQSAQSALCWLQKNAANFNIDPDRIAVSGASAGGQLAIAAALSSHADNPDCVGVTRPLAAAFVLFNPVLDLSMPRWSKHFGNATAPISPIELLHDPLPPTLILQGDADAIAPLATAQAFVEKAESLGSSDVQLVVYSGRRHGFFNTKRDLGPTVEQTRQFLQSLGWLTEAGK